MRTSAALLGIVIACDPAGAPDSKGVADPKRAPASKSAPAADVRAEAAAPDAPEIFARDRDEGGPWNEIGPVPGGKFVAVAGGAHTVCAVDDAGAPHCFGGKSELVDAPAGPLADITVGTWHACGRRPKGNLVCWGSDFERSLTAAPIGRFTAVAVDVASCVLDEGGTAKCWGPGKPAPAGRYDAVSAGSAYTCFHERAGAITCVAGDEFLSERSPLDLPARASAVFAGYEHVCTLDDDGHARCTGRDVQGETKAPDDAFSTLALGEKRSCGLTRAGEARCWGGRPGAPPTGSFSAIAITANEDQQSHSFVCAIRRDTSALACWDY